MAEIIILDQFSRNMFRGTNKMFAADPQARAAALAGIASGLDRGIVGEPRGFLYLPLMHSENLEDQRHCIRCYEVFAAESGPRLGEALAGNIKFGHAHKQIIETWGRFPHRNAALGRESSAEEIAFLARPNSSF